MRRMATPLMSDINITPLTDVMLVLLIIFMIASPMIALKEKEGEELKIPESEYAIKLGEKEHLLFINASGEMTLDETPATTDVIKASLEQWVDEHKKSGEKEGLKLFIAADETVPWKTLAELMSIAKGAGVEQIGMVEELITGEQVMEGEKPPEVSPPG